MFRVTFYVIQLLYFKVNAQRYFVGLSCTFLHKKFLLKVWLKPGLNLTFFRGTGPGGKKNMAENSQVTTINDKICFLFSLFYSEYVKIMDGSGATVLIRYGYSSTPQKPFREVNFGNSENITVQVYLYGSYSNVRLQFGIVQQGLQSGQFQIALILRAFVFLIIHVEHPKNAQISILLVPRVLFQIIPLKNAAKIRGKR